MESISKTLRSSKDAIASTTASLSKVLQPQKQAIGMVASHLTIAEFFTGALTCLKIRQNGTQQITSKPFVAGLFGGLAMLKYGLLIQDEIIAHVSFEAAILHAIYCLFYCYYSTDRWNEILKQLSIIMGLAALLWEYTKWEDPSVVQFRYEIILTVLTLVLLLPPLHEMKKVVSKKDASEMSLPGALMGSLIAVSWFLYGLVLMNNFLIVHDLVGFIVCSVQLILIYAYPGELSCKEEGRGRN